MRILLSAAIAMATLTTWAAPPFELSLRSQIPATDAGAFAYQVDTQNWDTKQTAVIVCDMWDSHHCYRAVQRVGELAPRMNDFLAHARNAGATIIHAPSSCMNFYQDHPTRLRAQAEPKVSEPPKDINNWCHHIDRENEDDYPIDQSDGGEDDSPEEHEQWRNELVAKGLNPDAPWTRQVAVLHIDDQRDFISDRGDEIWSLLANRSIQNVMLVGVHTNMCVLGRPFGLRQLADNGKNVVLVRDLTDTMYNPAKRPFVSHFTGTDLIIRYIERYVCPTISSDQILGGETFRFQTDRRPTIAVMIGESEYKTSLSLPKFAVDHLGSDYRVDFILESPSTPGHFVGLDSLAHADALLISVRRKWLPPEQLGAVRRYIASGRPVIGIRTSSHAFCHRTKPAPEGYADWKSFDSDVFGGNYTGHHRNGLASEVNSTSTADLTAGLPAEFPQRGSLYKTSPLAKGAEVLLTGRADDVADEPVAWTFKRADGGKSFYTSLGHPGDFEDEALPKLLRQAVQWAVPVNH